MRAMVIGLISEIQSDSAGGDSRKVAAEIVKAFDLKAEVDAVIKF